MAVTRSGGDVMEEVGEEVEVEEVLGEVEED